MSNNDLIDVGFVLFNYIGDKWVFLFYVASLREPVFEEDYIGLDGAVVLENKGSSIAA